MSMQDMRYRFCAKKAGRFEPYKIRAGFVLAGMEGIRYRCGSMQLEPGDRIFQYTDGVTEATNKANELYGMERLQSVLCKMFLWRRYSCCQRSRRTSMRLWEMRRSLTILRCSAWSIGETGQRGDQNERIDD